ncbi:SxtJ family membrane protein [Megalodesulfovibrio paquesii]
MASSSKKPAFHLGHSTTDCLNSGLALIFILLLVMFLGKHEFLMLPTLAVTLLLMIRPTIFLPFAALWLGISELMGRVMSKVILAIIFFIVVTPIAILRGLTGADPMKKKQWKKGDGSVYRAIDKTLGPEDLEHLF